MVSEKHVSDHNAYSDPHTNIGDSEHPGGMKTYCTPAGRYDSRQGQLPGDFWSNVEFKSGKGVNGGRYAKCTSVLCVTYISGNNLTIFSEWLHPAKKNQPIEP